MTTQPLQARAATTRLPTSELIQLAALLIGGARDHGLATPELVTVTRFAPHLDLQYPDTPHTARDLLRWANFFGAVVTSDPHTDEDGTTHTSCAVQFDYQAVRVRLYARLTTPAAPAA